MSEECSSFQPTGLTQVPIQKLVMHRLLTGVAKKLFSGLKKGIEIAENCECRSGCQNCTEPAKNYNSGNADDKMDKKGGVALARHILDEAHLMENSG